MKTDDYRSSEVYQSLLSEDFRKRIFPIAYVTSFFMFLAAMLNTTPAGNPTFFAIDLLIAVVFAVMGVLVKLKKMHPRIVAIILLAVFFVLYVMTLLHDGTVHGILFNYTVVPFVAFFIAGLRIARVYSFFMVVVFICFWLVSTLGDLTLAYDNREMGIFLLSLCFSVAGAWFFESIRERAFHQSYKQSQEYDALMTAIDEVHYRVDMQGVIQKIGAGITKFTDFSPEEVINQPIAMFYMYPEEREAYIEALITHGKVTNYPIGIKGRGGKLVNISMNAAIIFDKSGKPEFIEGVFRDVSKEVQSENERKAHLHHLRKLSVMEEKLSHQDLEQALEYAVAELLGIFSARRAFLTPICFQSDQVQHTFQHVFYHDIEGASLFSLEDFFVQEEVQFFLAPLPNQEKTRRKVITEPSIFSQTLMDRFGIATHAMIVLHTNQGACWLLGLQNLKKEISEQQQRLFMDVSKQILATLNQLLLQRDLEAAVVKAEVASKAKGEFVATISHELRTPLHGIIGLLDLMAQEADVLPEEQRKNLALAQASTQVLRSLIDDVLDLSKIESGNIEMQKQSFYLKQALVDALIPFVMKAREKGIELHLEMRDVAEMIEGDVQRLRQVLLNLVGNAIKFTAQGYVRIVVSQDEDMLFINIEDSGIGIDKDRQTDVFKPFSQVHNAAVLGDNLQEKGTGLGTTISQYFITMMGGELTLQSEPTVGSTMTIRLPLQQVGQEKISLDLQVEDLIDAPQMHHTAELNIQNAKPIAKSWRVLLAEDDPVGRRVAVKRLERAGFTVETVSDGLQAYAQLQTQSFDLLLTDIRMPGLTGLQLTEKIRENERKQGLSPMLIIGLSAYALEDVKRDALAAGMDSFISKPVDMTELIALLESKYEQNE